MDHPPIPPVTVDSAGTIRVGGRHPITPSIARERALWLMGRVERASEDEIVHPHYGAMTRAQAAALAAQLWSAAWIEVCRVALPEDIKRGA